ncbi:DNA damage-binding protein 1a [Acorus gramineus]|uniref:DNA damage-binding protein 1a n=1 Tax=Acorus gramineus TaxID=55184 RepID=A0AAV9ATM6_ACOGR|nr:DNA damage-binding protein 1a [Acorus gramineus]
MEKTDGGESTGGRSRSESNGTHYLAKCVLKGSVVLQALYGRFRSPFSYDVVFGRETSLELATIGEDGIVQSVCEQSMFGTIKDLAVLHWNDKFRAPIPQMQGKDLLVVLSDSGKLTFLTFSTEMHRFFPLAHIQISRPGNSRHQLGRMLTIDSNGCFIAVSAYEDRLALFSTSISAGSNIVDKKFFYPPEINEDTSSWRSSHRSPISGTIWSMCFISIKTGQVSQDELNPFLAMIIHRKGAALNELLLLRCNIQQHSLYVISKHSEAGPLALGVTEVPHISGLAFVFRLGDILLMDFRNPRRPCCIRINPSSNGGIEEHSFSEESCRSIDVDDEGIFNVAASALLELRDSGMNISKVDDPMNIDDGSDKSIGSPKIVSSWSWETHVSAGPKLIFCLDTGELFIVEVHADLEGFCINMSECLYRGLPCKTLLWATGGFIAALTEMGDGMVLKLENGRLLYESTIENIAPILDFSIVDCHDEKQNQIFACSGMGPEGSLRIIRSGISVEKLLRTAPIYRGITGMWTVRMKESDKFHSFLVLSFVEETRVLSVGLSFIDVGDAVGFQPDVCTLACGLLADGLLVQIHRMEVRLCLPTTSAHSEGISLSAPVCTSWCPNNVTISLGAVGHNLIIVATSNPCFLYILGVRLLSTHQYEIYDVQHIRLQNEISCVSIPRKSFEYEHLVSKIDSANRYNDFALPKGVEIGKTFIIGTHQPSVEVISLTSDGCFRILAVGVISITNALGIPLSGCIPQDVRLVLVDHLYILSGLRNGMLLRFEWPTLDSTYQFKETLIPHFSKKDNLLLNDSDPTELPYSAVSMMEKVDDYTPVNLQLVAIRRIGVTPVFLVPLCDSLDTDIISLSDRPWLLHSARQSLAYTSISFQPATHVTPVCSADCPRGILFVAENCLHLVEMVYSKRLNVQKFNIGGTPRKILYHSGSKTLLILSTGLYDGCSSEICCVDPLSGSILSTFKCDPSEMAKCMQLVTVGNEQILLVGTSQSTGRAIMPSGEAESAKGRLLVIALEHHTSDNTSLISCSKVGSTSASPFREIVGYAAEQLSSSSICSSPDEDSCEGVKFEETGIWHLRQVAAITFSGVVFSVCPYLDRYFLVSAGNIFHLYGFLNENLQRMRRFASARTRFTITALATCYTRIVVGDCRDGVLFFFYQEDQKKLEQLFCDPVQRLVADCALVDPNTVVVSDRRGNISVLSCSRYFEDSASPESNLTLDCSYNIGETVMSIRKGSFSYKFPVDDVLKGMDGGETVPNQVHNSIVACTLLGSVMVFIPITREEHELLEAVQARLAVHPLTSPVLGNDHREFRGRGPKAGVPTILDGDMLAQFLELTSVQQEAVLSSSGSSDTGSGSHSANSPISINQVVQLLERVHHALN